MRDPAQLRHGGFTPERLQEGSVHAYPLDGDRGITQMPSRALDKKMHFLSSAAGVLIHLWMEFVGEVVGPQGAAAAFELSVVQQIISFHRLH